MHLLFLNIYFFTLYLYQKGVSTGELYVNTCGIFFKVNFLKKIMLLINFLVNSLYILSVTSITTSIIVNAKDFTDITLDCAGKHIDI